MASARLEIHVINVGQGESILLINRDLLKLKQNLGGFDIDELDLLPTAMAHNPAALKGTATKALLIDGGEDMYGEDVVQYLEAQGVVSKGESNAPNLSVLMTHYHSDHIGGLPYLFIEQKAVPRVDTVDNYPAYQRERKQGKVAKPTVTRETRYVPGKLYFAERSDLDNRIGAYDLLFETAAKHAGTMQQFPVKAGGLDARTGERLEIDLGVGINGIPIKLRALAAIARVLDPKRRGQSIEVPVRTIDPNDRSIVLMLEYGSFRAFLGADIAGNGLAAGGNGDFALQPNSLKPFSQHGDVESVLMPQLALHYPRTRRLKANEHKFRTDGYCTLYKVSHHGSSSSNDAKSLAITRPRIAVISSGLTERFHHHPTSEVIGRLRSANCGVFITEIAGKVNGNTFPVDIGDIRNIGDVIVRPIDESISEIQGAATFGTPLKVQVFGSGIQTALADTLAPKTALRANAPALGSGRAPYPIGPFLLESHQH